MNLEQKKTLLDTIIGQFDSVAVAFSGGVDSTYLLAACRDVLGPERVLAVTGLSPGFPRQEQEEARRLADMLDVRWEVVHTRELENPDYVRNDANRCFYCKDELFRIMKPFIQENSIATIVYGANVDDVNDHRPGMLAARQHDVLAPLLKARLGKVDIRILAQQRGLPNHDKPAMACLASRVPYGSPITVQLLEQIDQAEAFLKNEVGLEQVRVRHHGKVARLEVDPRDIPRLAEAGTREHIVERLCSIGFTYVSLDLAGFRSGSMNAMLVQREVNGSTV